MWWDKVYNDTANKINNKKKRKSTIDSSPSNLLFGTFVKEQKSDLKRNEDIDDGNIFEICSERTFSQTSSTPQTGKLKRLRQQEISFELSNKHKKKLKQNKDSLK